MTTKTETKTVRAGTGPLFLLFLTFLVLKLTDVITWSWWWITAPLWAPLALVAAIFVVLFVVYSVSELKK